MTSPQMYTIRSIFFRGIFFAEGVQIDDLEVIEKLAERVGRDKIMVKIHPRNPHNRFWS